MKVNRTKQDLTYLTWTKIRNSSGTAGSFLKAYAEFNGEKIYYKLSNYDAYKGIIGHECVNEIIVDRLLSLLGIPHLEYELYYADVMVEDKVYTTYLCGSNDFKEKGESKIALDAFYQVERFENESPMEFCVRHEWEKYIYTMLVVDFIILNRDRHGANIEVLRNTKKKSVRLEPLFDHGLSLLFQCMDSNDYQKVDVLEDKRVQCFVGGNSAMQNLKLIPQDELPVFHTLKETDKDILFEELDGVVDKELQEKIWEMIFTRWKYYEDFCNQRRQ